MIYKKNTVGPGRISQECKLDLKSKNQLMWYTILIEWKG